MAAQTATAEISKLQFHVAQPAAGKSLEADLQAGLAQLRNEAKGGKPVRLRVFVAHGNDPGKAARLVQGAFPATSVVGVGAIAHGGRVMLEALTEARGVLNPAGVAFVSGQMTQAPLEGGLLLQAVAPMAEKSIGSIRSLLNANGMMTSDVLRVNCFASTLGDLPNVQSALQEAFPGAVTSVVQIEKESAQNEVECESVARLRTRPAERFRLVNPTDSVFAQMALVSPGPAVFSSLAESEGNGAGVRQAFRNLGPELERAGASYADVFYLYGYPANAAALSAFREARWDFLTRSQAPASTNLVFDGTAVANGAGIEAIAIPRQR